LVFNLIFHATTISGLHVDSSFVALLGRLLIWAGAVSIIFGTWAYDGSGFAHVG